MRATLVAFTALALLASPAVARKKPPEYAAPPPTVGGLLDDVNGYTFDDHGQLQRFTGLLIGKDGKVKQLLGPNDKRPEWLDFRLDGHGRTLLPGLIDADGHVMQYGMTLLGLDLRGTTSLADMQTRLANWAAHHDGPAWVEGFGWSQENWPSGHAPTAADVDLAVRDRPTVLERVDGQALVANTAAMAAAGITSATKDPSGGHVERDARGRPTGLFLDAAQNLIRRAMPAPAPIQLDEAFRKAQQALLAVGITATADMGTTQQDWEVLRRAGDAGALRIRIVSYGAGVPIMLAIAGTAPTPWLYDDHLRMVGVSLSADGALGSRGAWLKQPYADDPSTRGTPALGDTELKNLMSRAAMDGFQVAIHATGDAANAQVLDAIDELSDTYKGDRRWRIEGAGIVSPTDLPRFAQHGIVASMQPTQQASDWTLADRRLGPDRVKGAYAWATLAAEHVPLAFGSGYPVASPNPFPALAAAISREDAQGQPAGGWQPQEKIAIGQALAAFTTGAAYAARADDLVGSLEPGHEADFVLVDGDPLTATDPQAVRATKVDETWIGGKRVWVRKP